MGVISIYLIDDIFYCTFSGFRQFPYILRHDLPHIRQEYGMRIEQTSTQERKNLEDGFQTERGIGRRYLDGAELLCILFVELQPLLGKLFQLVGV